MPSLKDVYKPFSEEGPYGLTDKGTTHSYLDVYNELLAPYQNKQPLEILEIGVASGHSLLLWANYFTFARITGIDIHKNVAPEILSHPRIVIIQGDATQASTVDSLGTFDIIIDDGSHWAADQIRSFNLLYPRLNPGGIYFIEDINSDESVQQIRESIPRCEIMDFRPQKNRFDDILAIIRK